MGKIFISYRRSDSAYQSVMLYQKLVEAFGKESVFKDVDTIPLGVNFKTYLEKQVAGCQILLAVIGEKWLDIRDEQGQRRLEDPADFVRIEIATALEREIPVIPVLVGGVVPKIEELPENLRELAYRNGLEIRPDPDFFGDMDRLIRGIQKLLEGTPAIHNQNVGAQHAAPVSTAKQKIDSAQEEVRKQVAAEEQKKRAEEERRQREEAARKQEEEKRFREEEKERNCKEEERKKREQKTIIINGKNHDQTSAHPEHHQIEGRYPRVFLSSTVAAVVGKKATYIKNRGLSKEFYKGLVIDYLKKFGSASRKEIGELLMNKLSDILDEQQKKTQIRNLLYEIASKEKIIKNIGGRKSSKWVIS